MPSCSPLSSLTPSCQRVFRRFESYSGIGSNPLPGYLVLAVLAEESLASSCLNEYGISLAKAEAGCLGAEIAESFATLLCLGQQTDDTDGLQDITATRRTLAGLGVDWAGAILDRALVVARHQGDTDVSTQHLMQSMMEADTPVLSLLVELGMNSEHVAQRFGTQPPPVAALLVDFEFDLHVEEGEPARDIPATSDYRDRIVALLDANLNRCREGLRVLDDFARFVLRSNELTAAIKQLRHRLVAAEKTLLSSVPDLLACRDTAADAGTSITTTGEMLRESVEDLAAANARRVQESLRSLEEFGKLFSSEFAAEIKQIRYDSYSLHQQLCRPIDDESTSIVESPELRVQRQRRLDSARLYVLLTESLCRRPWKQVVQEVLAGGADVIQLREKHLDTSEVVSRGRWIAAACREANALFILNDLPEVAVRAEADGVHIGQEDVSPQQARHIVGPTRLVGLSTHNSGQIAAACRCTDIDYLGVGPVFPSGTKSFEDFPGLRLVGEASNSSSLPWFAIGGIQQSNLAEVSSAGATRVAVCGAIIGDANPWEATAAMRALLDEDSATELLKFNRG